MDATVAAACATIAGSYRPIGQVTPVASLTVDVRSAIAPSTLHANGL
jgi:hypothetical protein